MLLKPAPLIAGLGIFLALGIILSKKVYLLQTVSATVEEQEVYQTPLPGLIEIDETATVVKKWPVLYSSIAAFLPGKNGIFSIVEMGGLDLKEPLEKHHSVFSRERMMDVISFLSSDELMGRGFGTKGLDQAAEFIAGKFKEAGLKPAGDAEGSFFQIWEDQGGEPEHKVIMKNVIGVILGKKPELSNQNIVVGAHYDHLGLGWPDVREENRGKIHRGADDNASGVSVLIELALVLGKSPNFDRSVIFVAFTGEEAGKRGSRHYITNQKRYPVEKCIGMLNLDTVGRFGKKELLVLGAGSAKEWVQIFREAGFVTGVDIKTISEELDSSDQISFEKAGVPSIQLFTGPHLDYHSPTDTADKIDSEGLLKVASVSKEVIEYLSSREDPITATLKPGGNAESAKKKEKKVSLGTIPDFAYSGRGYRLSGVVPGSPAESCGLREGDIIVRINSNTVNSIKDLSDILRSLNHGTRVSVTFLRNGKEMTVEAELVVK